MSEENKITLKTVDSVIVNTSGSPLDGCLHSEASTNGVPAFINDNIEGNCQEKVKEMNSSESKNHDRSEFAKETREASSKILHCDEKLQTSEIEERVMGFFTKYEKDEEASCCGPNTVPSSLKHECVKEKEIISLNADDNSSDVREGELIENLSVKNKGSPDVSDAAESKNLAISHLSQSWSCKSPVQNSPVISNQEEINSKQCDRFKSDSSLRTNNSLSTLSGVKSVHPVSTSENDIGSFNPNTENLCLMNTFGPELHNLQQNNGTILNTFELESVSNQLKTSSNYLNQSDHSDYGSQNKRTKENELNSCDILSKNLPSNGNKSFETEKKCASKNTHTLSVPSLNDNIHSLSRNNAGVSVNSLISPWEKMSFQPQTTPSINSPILSSKSSNNNCISKYTGYSECRPVIFQSGNVNSGMPVWSSSLDCAPRTKSSDTIYNSGKFSNSGIDYLNNANVLNFVDSCFKSPSESVSSKCSVIDGEYVCDFSVNNLDRNSKNAFRGSRAEYFGVPIKENLTFESISNGSLFKTSNNNPFMKKASVQSIGLFKSPVRTNICGVGNFLSKSVLQSKSGISSIEEKLEDAMENLSSVEKYNPLNQNIINEPSPFLFHTFENKSNQKDCESSGFFRNECNEGQSIATEKPNQIQEVIGRKNNFHSEFLKSGFSFQNGVGVTPFQFTLPSVKPKSFTATRSYNYQITKKFVKSVGQYEKGFSYPVIDMKNSSARSITEKGTPFLPFCEPDPSDLKKIVRYHNITIMNEYINISPEELRFQFYTKFKSWPFKFCASLGPHSYKQTKSQETQTDEDLACKKTDLGSIWRVLECPVCLDVVLPPVYQCEQGHHVCLPCWNKVITCPLCKRHKAGTRNYMAEALVEQVPLPCRYHIEGCKESVQPANKVSHEEICAFRTYQCPVPLCNNAHSYHSMCKHFERTHKSLLHRKDHSVAKGEKFNDILYKETLSDNLVHAFDIANWGLFFLREITVNHSTALFVQIMPAVFDQAAYFYHLEVSDHHDCRQECYKGRVFPMGKSSQVIVNQEEYLSLSELIMKTVKKATPLKIVLRIWQLKPAFSFSTD